MLRKSWKELNNPLLQAKTYWSILKTFCNNKKIPLNLPLIRALNIHKAHGHDNITIRMIQILINLIEPLIILFQNLVKYSYYPDIRKRSNIIPLRKKVIKN